MIASSIQKDVKFLLEAMGFNFLHSPTANESEGRFFVDIFVDEPSRIIGERGANLKAFQLIVRLMAVKKYSPDIKIDIDINGYKKKREELIREMALSARLRALNNGTATELEPMSSYDRRVVHMALADYKDVVTGSVGDGMERRVVISLCSNS